MNLIIDIGNTNVKFAVFKENELVYHLNAKKEGSFELYHQISQNYHIQRAILSATSIVDPKLIEVLCALDFFLTLDASTPIPIKNLYKTPDTLGKDRLAAAVACHKMYNHEACLFIDMGTCITFNYIDEQGAFLGGNISPGIAMRLKAMHTFTDKLPLVDIQVNDDFFAHTTHSAIQNGGVKGAFWEIEAFIQETKAKYSPINVILTGGDAHLFESFTKNEIFVSPFLVLEGLNEILKYNAN